VSEPRHYDIPVLIHFNAADTEEAQDFIIFLATGIVALHEAAAERHPDIDVLPPLIDMSDLDLEATIEPDDDDPGYGDLAV
jgi:hypothetical protein